jgi:hypothetical protein
MRGHPIVAAFLLAATLSVEVCAQQLPLDVIQQISAASKLRVQLGGRDWRTLHAPTVDSVSLSSRTDRFSGGASHHLSREVSVGLAEVTQIQIARGSHAGSGAKIGGAVGLGLSLLAVAVTSGDAWVSPTTGQAVGAVVGWTAIGAGVGALIGSTSPRWITVYLRPTHDRKESEMD